MAETKVPLPPILQPGGYGPSLLPPPPDTKKPPKKKPKPRPGDGGFGGTTAPPLPPKPPKKKDQEHRFYDWAKKRGIGARVAKDVWFWGRKYQLDPYYWGAVLLAESGARHRVGGAIVTSPGGKAVGIGQIGVSHVGEHIPWFKNQKIVFTYDDNPVTGILNYAVNIRFSGFYLKQGVAKYGYGTPGSRSGAYVQYYNPADPNRFKAMDNIWQTLGSRPADIPALAPTGGSGITPPPRGAPVPQVPTFKNPYIAGVDKNNKLHTTNNPNQALQFNGSPLTRSQFLSTRDALTSWFVSYTGQRPSNRQVQTYILKGWNTYTLSVILSKGKNFKNSPIYKQFSNNYNAQLVTVLPPGQKVPLELVRQGAINHWDSTTLAVKLRKLPGYLASTEFKGNLATLMNTYSAIMGTPDANGLITIKDAALAGWSADQYASWLRSQPGYTRSPEYQTKALDFLGALGLIVGRRPVISSGGLVGPGPGGRQPSTQRLPGDVRVPGIVSGPPGVPVGAFPTLGVTFGDTGLPPPPPLITPTAR